MKQQIGYAIDTGFSVAKQTKKTFEILRKLYQYLSINQQINIP